MRLRKVIVIIEVRVLRHVSMAKSHCSIFCMWPLPADLLFNVLPEEK